MTHLEAVHGDITTQDVDAIVNAANNQMRGGGGVDGAIHRAAGAGLLQECVVRFPNGLATGEAGWTHGFDLPARFVIHTPGPNYRAGQTSQHLLATSYRNCLKLADELNVDSIAFPLISAGAYGFPLEDAINTAVEVLATTPTRVSHIRIVTTDASIRTALLERLARLTWLRLLQGVGVLHQRGYEGVRIYPGESPSGMHWRVQIAASENFESHPMMDDRQTRPSERAPQLAYTTGTGTQVGTGYVTTATTPEEAADIITQQLPTLAREQSDPEYVVWFQALLSVCEGLEKAPSAYSDFSKSNGKISVGDRILFPSPPRPLHLRG